MKWLWVLLAVVVLALLALVLLRARTRRLEEQRVEAAEIRADAESHAPQLDALEHYTRQSGERAGVARATADELGPDVSAPGRHRGEPHVDREGGTGGLVGGAAAAGVVGSVGAAGEDLRSHEDDWAEEPGADDRAHEDSAPAAQESEPEPQVRPEPVPGSEPAPVPAVEPEQAAESAPPVEPELMPQPQPEPPAVPTTAVRSDEQGSHFDAIDSLDDGGYGIGSAAPLPSGEQPLDHPVKAFEDSKTYRTPDSSAYGVSVPDVWFYDENAAEAAGFVRADD